jgi:hypothetical protein
MGRLKASWQEEYEQAFPYEQEYESWIASMERDYREECQYRASLAVTDKARVVLQKDNTEDYSPYITVNS